MGDKTHMEHVNTIVISNDKSITFTTSQLSGYKIIIFVPSLKLCYSLGIHPDDHIITNS